MSTTDLTILGGTLVLSIIFAFFANKYKNKAVDIVKNNKNESTNYSKSIIVGIVSGIIVVAVDKIVTQLFNHPFTIDTSSIYNLMLSIVGILIFAFLIGSFILLIAFFLFYKGLSSSIKKK